MLRHACTCTHIYTHTQTQMLDYRYVDTHTHAWTCTYLASTCICTHIHTCLNTHRDMLTHMHAHLCTYAVHLFAATCNIGHSENLGTHILCMQTCTEMHTLTCMCCMYTHIQLCVYAVLGMPAHGMCAHTCACLHPLHTTRPHNPEYSHSQEPWEPGPGQEPVSQPTLRAQLCVTLKGPGISPHPDPLYSPW